MEVQSSTELLQIMKILEVLNRNHSYQQLFPEEYTSLEVSKALDVFKIIKAIPFSQSVRSETTTTNETKKLIV